MQAFTHFLLGKDGLDDNDRAENLRELTDRKLMLLLDQKEKGGLSAESLNLAGEPAASAKLQLQRLKSKM